MMTNFVFHLFFYLAVGVTLCQLYWFLKNRHEEGPRNHTDIIRTLTLIALVDLVLLLIPCFLFLDMVKKGAPRLTLIPFYLVSVFQTTSLDADYSAAYKIRDLTELSPLFRNAYFTFLSWVSCLVPAFLALAAATAFYNRAGYYTLFLPWTRCRTLYIFNAMNSAATALVTDTNHTLKKPGSVRYIFCGMKEDPSGSEADSLSNLKVYYVRKGPSSVLRDMLKRHKNIRLEYVFLSDSEDKNLNDTIEVLKTVGKMKEKEKKKNKSSALEDRIHITLLTESVEMGNILDSQEKHGVMVRMVDRELSIACSLLRRRPLFACYNPPENRDNGDKPAGKAPLRMLVIGGTQTAASVLNCAVWMGEMDRMDFGAIYVGEDADKVELEMRVSCPGLFYPDRGSGKKYELSFWKMSLKELVRQADSWTDTYESDVTTPGMPDPQKCISLLDSVNYIVAAASDDEENIASGMLLRSWYCRKFHGTGHRPLINVLIHNSNKTEKLKNLKIQDSSETYNLYPFGMDESIFSRKFLLENPLYRVLENIQYSYSEPYTGEIITSEHRKAAAEELNKSSYSYLSSYANAVYTFTRLFDAGVAEEYLHDKGLDTSGDMQGRLLNYAFPEGEASDKDTDLKRALPAGPDAVRDELLRRYTAKLWDKKCLNRLAIAEHNRWNAYMCATGWVTMSPDDMRAYVAAHGGSHKDYLALKHPCITSWDNLPEISRIKTNEEDPDKYQESDRIMVSRLPVLVR